MVQFRAMRRLRQQLSEEESISILRKCTAGTLALLGDNDYPYAVPISYVYADGRLYFHSALSGHKVDAIRKYDKASFCVIAQDEVHPEKYTTFFRSVIGFGRIHIIEDEGGTHDVDNIAGGYHEKQETARMLGNRYNPNQEEALQKELENGLSRMLMICFDIEHLTGKEAIELMKQREQSQACLNSAEIPEQSSPIPADAPTRSLSRSLSRQKKTEGQLVKHKNNTEK